MPTGILDSFQIVVALYLFYIAFKGSGQMYRFGDMDEETQQQIRTPLRLLYAAGGLIALIEFGLCCLPSRFSRAFTIPSPSPSMKRLASTARTGFRSCCRSCCR